MSEVVDSRVRDLDLEEMMLHIHGAKGQKDRMSVLPEKLIGDLRGFVAGKSGNDPVFSSERGGKLKNIKSPL